MNRFNIYNRLVIGLSTGLLLTACATYYEVKDPTTGKNYYTQEIKRDGSASMFKDARSGAEVTIQNSEIKEISGKEYDAGLKAPVTKPAPASSAAPAPTSEPAPLPEPSAAPDQGSSPAESSK